MYYKSYQQLLREAPDTPGKQFLIRLMNTPKPDFEKMGREVHEFEDQLVNEYLAGQNGKESPVGQYGDGK
ncbi:MAG: hypothetical protein K6G18_01025 [Treponema sp.]|jgi:hypothetical protein|nr:hypothetical protein [Treponema sp.]